MLAALAVAHDAGLVHRDVKPGERLDQRPRSIKVADFGLAKASSQSSTATQGLLIGTVILPPAGARGVRQGPTRDQTSTAPAWCFFELLTGRKPHTGDTPIQIAYAHVHRDVPPPSVGPTGGRFRHTWTHWSPGDSTDANLRQPDAKVFLAQVRRARSQSSKVWPMTLSSPRELHNTPHGPRTEAEVPRRLRGDPDGAGTDRRCARPLGPRVRHVL